MGCAGADRFADNLDGTVTDACTGLMWQKDSVPEGYTWGEALAYCEALELAGHSDWRLPNIRELLSIVESGRVGPAIAPVFGVAPGTHWSSTTFTYAPGEAWYVYLELGSEGHDAKARGNLVLAVRDAR